MATKTVRKNDAAVALTGASDEVLEYRLKVSGARANFAWVDDKGTTILTHLDFGLVNEVVWQLQSAKPDGKVVLTVPQKASYRREEDPGTMAAYTVSLAFVTAVAYTLTVIRKDAAGAEAGRPTDLDYKMEQPTDIANEGLDVSL
jgi:hypothetical protein